MLRKNTTDALISFIVGGLCLLLAVLIARQYVQDRREWNLLRHRGAVQAVPLTRLRSDTCGNDTCYQAVYFFHNASRREWIDYRTYKRLAHQKTVRVFTYGNQVHISENPPDYTLYWAGMGFMLLLTGYCFINGARAYRRAGKTAPALSYGSE